MQSRFTSNVERSFVDRLHGFFLSEKTRLIRICLTNNTDLITDSSSVIDCELNDSLTRVTRLHERVWILWIHNLLCNRLYSVRRTGKKLYSLRSAGKANKKQVRSYHQDTPELSSVLCSPFYVYFLVCIRSSRRNPSFFDDHDDDASSCRQNTATPDIVSELLIFSFSLRASSSTRIPFAFWSLSSILWYPRNLSFVFWCCSKKRSLFTWCCFSKRINRESLYHLQPFHQIKKPHPRANLQSTRYTLWLVSTLLSP